MNREKGVGLLILFSKDEVFSITQDFLPFANCDTGLKDEGAEFWDRMQATRSLKVIQFHVLMRDMELND